MTGRRGPRVGYWGRANLGAFGEVGRFLVFEAQIRRRIPGAEVHAYAPLGPRVPGAAVAGFGIGDLGEWSGRRAAELAETLDCVVVGGEEPIPTTDAAASAGYGSLADAVRRTRPSSFFLEGVGPELAGRCPTAWDAVRIGGNLGVSGGRRLRAAVGSHPYLSVRDAASKDRLTRAGIENVVLVPDPLLLLPDVFPRSVLARRLEFVRQMDWFPREGAGPPLVLQGSGSSTKFAEATADSIAEALEKTGASLVLLELDPDSGEGEFLDAVARAMGSPVRRVPAEASFLDRLTVLAHARLFLGSSPGGRTAAAAFGAPSRELEGGAPDAASIERLLNSARTPQDPPREVAIRLAEHFDALARVAERAWTTRLEESPDSVAKLAISLAESERRLDAWRTAHEARSREVLEGRLRMAALLEASKSDVDVHFQRLLEELARVRAEQQAFYADAERVSKDAAATREALRAARADVESTRLAQEAAEARASRADDEIARLRNDHERIESALAQSRETIHALGVEIERARDEAALAKTEGERRGERAGNEIAELRGDLDRAQAKLEVLRGEEAELRTTQTLLFNELAEARAELGRSAREADPS
jgi:hypothetical protein